MPPSSVSRAQVLAVPAWPVGDVARVAVVVPVYRPGACWGVWVRAMLAQVPAWPVWVLESCDGAASVLPDVPAHWGHLTLAAQSFNHGASRNEVLRVLPEGVEVVVFLTQDAVLAGPGAVQALLAALEDPAVACAYGRQLPHADATPVAAHARRFNYPQAERRVVWADRERLGLRACFLSNSFAAYRLADLRAVGGFPSDVILGEDMSVAARVLMAGKAVAYVPEACVYHSHNYSVLQEFRRYFDTGVFHARNAWLLAAFGAAGGEGWRFVRSEWTYLAIHAPWCLGEALVRTAAKWLGYRLGRSESRWPLGLKRWCSMHRAFWLAGGVS